MATLPPNMCNFPAMLHGADYNPEQWLKYPGIIDKDIAMMQEAHCNVVSIGIFSWSMLEPSEGQFDFNWLDNILDKLNAHGIKALLATPSGARPAWLSNQYPEVLRVDKNRVRALHGGRHNHCLTSPAYRLQVKKINTQLAERYSQHPGVIGWHLSNEYGGECHCPLCQDAFRAWLKDKYKTLEALNESWWSNFWSHTFTDWDQIESPSPIGEVSIHGLNLDWKRFNTAQVVRFCEFEANTVKAVNPDIPVTTNFMEYFYDYDYWQLAKVVDIVSWDNYPRWHGDQSDLKTGVYIAMYHDLMRTLKGGQPFLLMESTPSATNWQPISKLKKPGMHILSSIQAIAHGSNSVQYFQWRKSRGSCEKFHGAVVDHVGHLQTRVGQEVIQLGEILEKLGDVTQSTTPAEVAIVFDWDSRWAMDDAQGPRNQGLFYETTVNSHYQPFWEMGIPVDIINQDCDLSKYKLVIAPMLYMVKDTFAAHIHDFVKNGGHFVSTYWSGIVNQSDLCYLGGFPGPLKDILGIWSEEIDSLYDDESNQVIAESGNPLQMNGSYKAIHLCDLIHLEGATALAHYGSDFYKGRPALTVNQYQQGKAYYIASRNDDAFQRDFTQALAKELQLKRALPDPLPLGVTAQIRCSETSEYIFVQNFTDSEQTFQLSAPHNDLLTQTTKQGAQIIRPFGVVILQRERHGEHS
ncbi:beta-galactosidase [Celerinatantimonas sp. YJH-8]|uniref:beta-galactosidase n=1 Tax=Celerinatantimonas sp. YJH-8 TaxID=3228714 RepID=UPI0038C2B93D